MQDFSYIIRSTGWINAMYIETQSPLWHAYTQKDAFVERLENVVSFCVHSELSRGFPKLVEIPKEKGYDVNIIFSDDVHVRAINKEWRGKDSSTNILSFPTLEDMKFYSLPPDEAVHLGDLLLAFETIEKEANETILDMEEHIMRLIIHGMYHLLGYDHMDDDDYAQMFAQEQKALQYFSIKQYIDKP